MEIADLRLARILVVVQETQMVMFATVIPVIHGEVVGLSHRVVMNQEHNPVPAMIKFVLLAHVPAKIPILKLRVVAVLQVACLLRVLIFKSVEVLALVLLNYVHV